MAQGTILNILQKSVREKNLKKNMFVLYSWITLLWYLNLTQHCKSATLRLKKGAFIAGILGISVKGGEELFKS